MQAPRHLGSAQREVTRTHRILEAVLLPALGSCTEHVLLRAGDQSQGPILCFLKAVVCTCVCVCVCVCMHTRVVRGRGGRRVCLWSSESGSTLCPGLQGGKSQFSLGWAAQNWVGPAWLLLFCSPLPRGPRVARSFWFQGPGQLDFVVKRWDFKDWQFLFFSSF